MQSSHVIHFAIACCHPTRDRCSNPDIEQAKFIAEQTIVFSGTYAGVAKIIVEFAGVVGGGNLLNAGKLFAVLVVGIAVPAICSNETVSIGFAIRPDAVEEITASGALKHAVCDGVAMSGRRNRCSPINNGVADFAERSACVARFRAGCGFVRKCNGIDMVCRGICVILLCFRSVVMSAVPCCIVGGFGFVCPIVSLGVNLNLGACECIGCAVNKFNFAANDGSAYVDRPDFIAVSVFGIHPNIFTNSVRNYCGKFPSSDGHGNEHSLSRCIVFTGAGNGNGRDVLVLVGNNIRSGEALRDFHVVEFPFAYVVKVDIRADGLNLFDIRRNKVYIINRAEEDIVERRIVRGKFNGGYAGICFYVDLTDSRGIIALLVANREFNGVNAVRENAVRNGHNAALDCAGNFNAVHIRFCGGFVKSCCIVFYQICNHRAERNIVIGRFGNFSSDERNRIAHTGRCPTNVTEYRSVSVIYRRRIINCYIVKIHNNIDVLRFMFKVVVTVFASVAVVYIEVKHGPVCGNAPISAFKIEVNVVPTRLVVFHGETAVPVAAVVDKCGSRIGTFNGLYRPILVSLGYFLQENTSVERLRLYREPDPHTETRSAFKVYSLTALVLYAETSVHITGLGGNGEVGVESHGVIAAVNFAVLCGNYRATTGSYEVVVVCCRRAVKLGNISVFKVPENFGAFAEINGGGGGNGSALKRCRYGTRRNGSVACRERKPVNSSDAVIGKYERNIGDLKFNFI